MGSLRVTDDLHQLLRDTAQHVGLDVSDVIRRSARGIMRGRPVVHFNIKETYYKRPGQVIRVRGFTMPPGIEPEDFRRRLAMRCMEELQKQKFTRPTFKEVEGVDYIIEDKEE